MKRLAVFILLLTSYFLSLHCLPQPAEYRNSREEYIETYKHIAIKEMVDHGIPASITLAQGILESDAGNSPLAKNANNHFGIKCHADWTGKKYYHDDDRRDECFRVYKHAEESFDDHTSFLTERNRYAFLFELKTTDYKAWAQGLKQAGYATDRHYASRLIRIIEDYNLAQYDQAGKVNVKKPEKVKKETVSLPAASEEVTSARKVLLNNDVKYVVVGKGDTYYRIAQDFDMRLWQLHKYNETGGSTNLHVGDKIYLQPKRRRSRTEKFHVVEKGETMYDISQNYGIKTRYLCRLNHKQQGEEPKEGERLVLK